MYTSLRLHTYRGGGKSVKEIRCHLEGGMDIKYAKEMPHVHYSPAFNNITFTLTY